MRIETEFTVGQQVCFMRENAVAYGKIEGITAYSSIVDGSLDIRVKYKVRHKDSSYEFGELKLFPDKHSLISSL